MDSWLVLQVPVKPVHGAADRIDLIFPFLKAMTYVWVVVCVHSLAVPLKQLDDMGRLFFRYARIVVTLQDQQGNHDMVNVRDGRRRVVGFLILDWIAQQALLILL